MPKTSPFEKKREKAIDALNRLDALAEAGCGESNKERSAFEKDYSVVFDFISGAKS